MKDIIRFDLDHMPEANPGLTLALGNFDGVHRGHQRLFVETSLEASGDAAVLFFAHPFGYGPSLSSLEDKIRYAGTSRLDKLYVFDNDERVFGLSAEEFIERVLLPLGTKTVVVGEDFRFGKNRSGDASLLQKYFRVIVVPLLEEDGSKVSSTRIKELLHEGDILKANALLGRSYEIKGTIVHGFHNGSKIGFPTANIDCPFPYVLPQSGVYCGVVYLSGKAYRAMVNVGSNPTIGALDHPIIEAHILDFDDDCYDKTMYCAFLAYIRPEMKFDSMEELQKQLRIDETKIRDILA